MTTAIFGGTFDPVHRGHLEVARAAAAEFSLGRVLFIPSGLPPHRSAPTAADYEDRLRMVELACAAEPLFEASRLEDPAQRRGPHYSVDTIRRARAELGVGDGEKLLFLLGADAFREIGLWRQWREVVRLVEFAVAARPGHPISEQDVPEGARVHWMRSVDVPITSTAVREGLLAGEFADAWLTPEVADYIRQQGLYREQPGGRP